MTAHETYMRTALEAAREAARLGEIPVGACIVRDGEILSVGYNTRESERDPLGHAEMAMPSARPVSGWGAGGWTAVCCM